MSTEKTTNAAPVDGIVMPFEDRNHEWNSSQYHSGKKCVEGCGRDAGTAWSPHWCFECNVERMSRITKNLNELAEQLKA